MNEGQIFIEGLITPDTTAYVKRQLEINASADSFCIHISSPGGSVYDGYKIYHAIKAAKQGSTKPKPVRAVIEGEAQSMATFIACVADKGSIEIADPSRYMIHNPSMGVESDKDGLIEGAEELGKIEAEMINVYALQTGLSEEQIRAMMKKTTKMTAQEAVRYGFANTISKHLRAVAVGKPAEKPMSKKANILEKISGLFKEAATAEGPGAMNIELQEGGTLVTDAPDEASLVGSNATMNGAPAEGEYKAANGMTIACTGGKITAVTPAPDAAAIDAQIAQLQQKKAGLKPAVPVPAPAPAPPTQTADQKLAIAEAELAKIKAEKAEAEAAKLKAEQEKVVTAAAVAKVEKEFEEFKLKTVGTDDNPTIVGLKPGQPVGFMPTAADKKSIYATRTYLADNMRWLESKYPGGKYADGTTFDSYRTGGPNAVSILETNFSYTWTGIITSDIFFKPTLNSPALSDIWTVDPGTHDKKQYTIVNPLSKVLLPYTGCTSTPNGNRALFTNKTMQVKPFRLFEGWCVDDFTGQLGGSYNWLAQEWLKTGEARFDPAGTPIDRIITQLLKDALRRDVFRRVSFGDADSSDADYNQINGFWPSLIDQSSTNAAYCVYREGTALGVGTLAADTASARFTSMYNNSPLLLKQEFIDNGAAQFLVTRSVWENYYNTIVAVGSVSEQEYVNYLQGIKRLTFRGIPVIPITIWDSFLAESDNPLGATSKHLIALTPKENHIVGVEDTGDLTKLDSWYEMKDSKRYYRASLSLGFLGPIHCELTTIAY